MLREERKKMTFFSSLSLCLLRFKYEKKKKKKRIKVEKVSYQQQNTAKPNLPNKIKEKRNEQGKHNFALPPVVRVSKNLCLVFWGANRNPHSLRLLKHGQHSRMPICTPYR